MMQLCRWCERPENNHPYEWGTTYCPVFAADGEDGDVVMERLRDALIASERAIQSAISDREAVAWPGIVAVMPELVGRADVQAERHKNARIQVEGTPSAAAVTSVGWWVDGPEPRLLLQTAEGIVTLWLVAEDVNGQKRSIRVTGADFVRSVRF